MTFALIEQEQSLRWTETHLGEISEYITSGSRDWSKYYADSGALFIRTQDINTNRLRLDDVARVKLPEKVEGKRTRIFRGDILITITGANVGKVALVENEIEEAYVSQSVALVRLKDPSFGKFLHYQLMTKSSGDKTHLEANAYGLGRPVLNLDNIRAVPIRIVPLEHQTRIVAEIGKQFSRLHEAIGNLARVKANLKRYKAAVIKAAVEGKFVNDQDGKWQNTTIGDVSELVTKGSSPNWQGFDYVEKGIVFVRSQNVGWGNLDLSDVSHLPSSFNSKEKKSVLKTDDVLLNIVGASIGRATVATKQVEGGNINQAVSVIRPSKEHLLSKFLMYYLLSDMAQKLIHSQKVDVARANYSLDQIKRMPLHLPPLEIQKNIVAEVESRLSTVEEIGAVASSNLTRADNLRQALLRKAFAGQLAN